MDEIRAQLLADLASDLSLLTVMPTERPITSVTEKTYLAEKNLWERFKAELDMPVEEPSLLFIKAYFKWCARILKGKLDNKPNISTLVWRVNRFALMIRRFYGYALDQDMLIAVRKYINTDLRRSLDLKEISYTKNFATYEDIKELVSFIWVKDQHCFRHERLRIQAVLFMLLLQTGARPGAILRSDCYRDRNDALYFKDIVLWAELSEDKSSLKFHMDITFHLMKGARNDPLKFVTKSVEEDKEDPATCTLLMFMAMCFIDNVFEELETPEQLFTKARTILSEGRHAMRFPYKSSACDKPIFRRLPRGANEVSDNLAWSTTSGASVLQRVAKDAGFPQRFTPYNIRRGVSNKLDTSCSTAQRLQIMGHGTSTIYSKHYLAQHTNVNIQGIYKGRGSRMHSDDVRGMRMEQDLSAPKKLPPDHFERLQKLDPVIQKLLHERQGLKDELYSLQHENITLSSITQSESSAAEPTPARASRKRGRTAAEPAPARASKKQRTAAEPNVQLVPKLVMLSKASNTTNNGNSNMKANPIEISDTSLLCSSSEDEMLTPSGSSSEDDTFTLSGSSSNNETLTPSSSSSENDIFIPATSNSVRLPAPLTQMGAANKEIQEEQVVASEKVGIEITEEDKAERMQRLKSEIELATQNITRRRAVLKRRGDRDFREQWFLNRPSEILRSAPSTAQILPQPTPEKRQNIVKALYYTYQQDDRSRINILNEIIAYIRG